MRRRMMAVMVALAAALALTGVAASPAQAAGQTCSQWTTVMPNTYGMVCVSATAGNATNAWAYFYNGSNVAVATEVLVYINGNILHNWCGTGVGQGVQPGQTLQCLTNATRWTASPRYANATFYANNYSRSVSTNWLY